ncbi:MAG: hypothetical protein WAX77_06120 [Methylococcaceae bacterium]
MPRLRYIYLKHNAARLCGIPTRRVGTSINPFFYFNMTNAGSIYAV